MGKKPFRSEFKDLLKKYRVAGKPGSAYSPDLVRLRGMIYDLIEAYFTPERIMGKDAGSQKSGIEFDEADLVLNFLDHESKTQDHESFFTRGIPVMQILANAGNRRAVSSMAGIATRKAEFLNRKSIREKMGDNPMAPFAAQGKAARLQRAADKIRNKKEMERLLSPLHSMIGCAPVKEKIESLIFLAHANALRLKKNIDRAPLSLHAAFLGAPGTGKTTIARMYSQILHELGYLNKGHVVEVSRADLVAEYIGQTAPLIRQKVNDAIGGVLFIDEAHTLVPDDSTRDFGPEAVSELIQQMENRRENFVVIFAGYTEEMHYFLKMNPGLKSRVPNIIEFPPYTPEEMVEIFNKICQENKYNATPEAQENVLKIFKKMDKETVARMGNARGVRNIFEESIAHQARRLFHSGKTSKKALITLEAEDIFVPGAPPSTKHLRVIKDSD